MITVELRTNLKNILQEFMAKKDIPRRGMKYFNCFSKNREKSTGGGICSAMSKDLKSHAVCVGEGGEEDEWICVRFDHVSPCLTIVNCYGEQEGRSSKEEVVARLGRLRKELERIRSRGNFCLLIGDLNKLVGTGSFGIPAWKPPGGVARR